MKRLTILLSIILLPICLIAQSTMWPVKALAKNGKALPVKAYLADGTAINVFAIYEAGNDHFMDVKGLLDDQVISIKLVATNDILIPVKGISENGDVLDVKAVGSDGNLLDIKGVGRDGNTMDIAAVPAEGRNMPLKAISSTGIERDVKGVQFLNGNFEMEIGQTKVIAHVKALPSVEVGAVDKKWKVNATADNGVNLDLFAISKKGKEYPVEAVMPGKNPYLMNVRADASITIFIKLVKNDEGLLLTGIDEFGRLYEVKARAENGASYQVIGGESVGNVTPIYVVGEGGAMIPVKATSSEGHIFDIKGIKVKKDEVEGMIQGLDVWIRYHTHVKALAPAQVAQ